MVIYGVGLLAGCMLAGLWAGRLLGLALGVEANVGGVGIAMLLLLFFTECLRVVLVGFLIPSAPPARSGVAFGGDVAGAYLMRTAGRVRRAWTERRCPLSVTRSASGEA